MHKKVFIITLLLSVAGMTGMKIPDQALFAPTKLGKLTVSHGENGFKVKDKKYTTLIQPCFVDPKIRKISNSNLKKLIALGGYFTVNKLDNGQYTLKLMGRLKGGGVGGATAGFWIGKTVTYGLWFGGISVVSAFTGPAAPATFATLTASLSPFIEGTSNAVAVGTGVLGGVATGPV